MLFEHNKSFLMEKLETMLKRMCIYSLSELKGLALFLNYSLNNSLDKLYM